MAETHRENFITTGLPCLDSTFFLHHSPLTFHLLKDHLQYIQTQRSCELYSQLYFILFSAS